MAEFKIDQLTKEMVVARLKVLGDPCAAAAEIAKKTLLVALKGSQGPGNGKVVQDVAKGAMVGLLLAEQNLPKGAVCVLDKVSETASELSLDPTETMVAALRGFAELKTVLSAEQLQDIRESIALNFMGAGEAFGDMIEARPAGVPTARIPPLI